MKKPYTHATEVQTLLFDADLFTEKSAKAWARSHGFRYGKVDVSGSRAAYIRIRQHDPSEYRPSTFRTISLDADETVKAIVGVPLRAAAATRPAGYDSRGPRRNPAPPPGITVPFHEWLAFHGDTIRRLVRDRMPTDLRAEAARARDRAAWHRRGHDPGGRHATFEENAARVLDFAADCNGTLPPELGGPRENGKTTKRDLLAAARAADRDGDRAERELSPTHATVRFYRDEAESYRRRAKLMDTLRGKKTRSNPFSKYRGVSYYRTAGVYRAHLPGGTEVFGASRGGKRGMEAFIDGYLDMDTLVANARRNGRPPTLASYAGRDAPTEWAVSNRAGEKFGIYKARSENAAISAALAHFGVAPEDADPTLFAEPVPEGSLLHYRRTRRNGAERVTVPGMGVGVIVARRPGGMVDVRLSSGTTVRKLYSSLRPA